MVDMKDNPSLWVRLLHVYISDYGLLIVICIFSKYYIKRRFMYLSTRCKVI